LVSAHELTGIKNESCEVIYTSHTLEYYDFTEIVIVLNEFRRVLKTKGKLYITVPNFDSLIDVYRKSHDIDQIIGPLFGRWINPTSNGKPIYHKCVFTKSKLSTILTQNGFTNITTFNPIEFLGAYDKNYDDYSLAYIPHFDKKGIQISLALVCEKD